MSSARCQVESWYVLGNPGSGKSAVLNGLCPEMRFKSGVSIGDGLTAEQKRVVVEVGGIPIELVDTPGLNDLTNQTQCAKVVTEALKGSARCKLFFVVKLTAGRMQGGDVAVMHAILTALDEAVRGRAKYVVVLNAVDEKKLSRSEPKWLAVLVAKLQMLASEARLPPPADVLTFPFFHDAFDVDDYHLGKESRAEAAALQKLQIEMFASPLNEVDTSRVRNVELDEERIQAAYAMADEAEKKLKANMEQVDELHEKLAAVRQKHDQEMGILVAKLEANEGQINSLKADLERARKSSGGWWSFIPFVGPIVDAIRNN